MNLIEIILNICGKLLKVDFYGQVPQNLIAKYLNKLVLLIRYTYLGGKKWKKLKLQV